MAITKQTKKDDDKRDPNIAEPQFAPGDQTTTPGKEQVLPRSTPEEVAPVPDASGQLPSDKEPEPSESGYRVADGKSITASTGDVIDAGHEITEKHLAGGAQRLEELVKSGHVVKTAKGKPKNADGEELPPLHGVDGNKPIEPTAGDQQPVKNPPADPLDLRDPNRLFGGPTDDKGGSKL